MKGNKNINISSLTKQIPNQTKDRKNEYSKERFKVKTDINHCHRIRKIGSTLNIHEIESINIYGYEEKENLFSKIRFGVRNKNIHRKYILFFEEKFFYLLNDQEIMKLNNLLRRIEDRFVISDIQNVSIEDSEKENISIIKYFLKSGENINIKKFMLNKNLTTQLMEKISKFQKI